MGMMILKWGEGGEVDTSLQTMMKKKRHLQTKENWQTIFCQRL